MKIDKNLIFDSITGIQPLSKMTLPILVMRPLNSKLKTFWNIHKSLDSKKYIVETWEEYDSYPMLKYSNKFYYFDTEKEAENFVLIEKLSR